MRSFLDVLPVAALAWVILPASLSAEPLSAGQRQEVRQAIDAYAPRMNEIADRIWAKPELGYREFETSALLQKELQDHGFKVEAGVAGMRTAFVARRGRAGGPVIAIMAEMDALPGFSQAAVPEKKAIEGDGSGHACGHNLFGAGSVAAAIAIADWLEKSGIKGEIRVYGTPAEENGAGKAFMLKAGLFNDVDVTLHWHPDNSNSAAQKRTLTIVAARIAYHGVAAHAGAAPDKGRSALDGIEALTHMMNLMREHVPQETRIHYIITNGGKAANVVPDFAELELYVRHPDPAVAIDVFNRIEKAAEGAALGTGTTHSIERTPGNYSVLPNDVLGRVMDANLRAAEPIAWSAEETKFGTVLQASLGGKVPALTSVAEIDDYKFGGQVYYSTDVGDVSWVTPTVGLQTASWVPGTANHSWQVVAAGGMGIGHKGMKLAAATLAMTGIELFQSPETLVKAKAEFDAARGARFHLQPADGR